MIVIDGQPVTIPDGTGDGDARQLDLLDLKLSNALLALGPPDEVAKLLHTRISCASSTTRRPPPAPASPPASPMTTCARPPQPPAPS
jgi:hypothetical protein